MYTNDDTNVLSNMANQSALAIENAQFLKEREGMQVKLREAETLTTIRDLLGSFNHELYNLLTPVGAHQEGTKSNHGGSLGGKRWRAGNQIRDNGSPW